MTTNTIQHKIKIVSSSKRVKYESLSSVSTSSIEYSENYFALPNKSTRINIKSKPQNLTNEVQWAGRDSIANKLIQKIIKTLNKAKSLSQQKSRHLTKEKTTSNITADNGTIMRISYSEYQEMMRQYFS